MSRIGATFTDGDAESSDGGSGASSTTERRQRVGRVRGVPASRAKARDRDDTSSSLSSASSQSPRRRSQVRWPRLQRRSRGLRVSPGSRDVNKCLQDLALPLGVSFAAVVVQVLLGKNISGDMIQFDHLPMICTLAVKESITAIYGDKFDCFLRIFDKSFHSTLKTLGIIHEASVKEQKRAASSIFDRKSRQNTTDLTSHSLVGTIKDFQEDMPLNYASNQIILHRHVDQHLANAYSSTSGIRQTQSILGTIERSLTEQTRSNDLKELELRLAMEKLKMKQSQLDISSEANRMGKIKISLDISKVSFKEEKLRNQMQEKRHAQLLQQCMDLLITGLIIMCFLMLYGASIYSYERITDVTFACESALTEARVSWWMPKQVQTVNSGLTKLRCHVVALSRMSFGILMILSIAYVVFKRSGTSAPRMPVTFIVLLLGVLCGFCGKLCIDTLGGNGYRWLMYWEALCMVHFLVNVFPSAFYHILCGPVIASDGANSVKLPYVIRRYMFYALLVLILPLSGGLLPFASFSEWAMHFSGILGAQMYTGDGSPAFST